MSEPAKKKKSTGSARGFPFERVICKLFSQWWAGEEGADIFWRTAQSGGRATSRKKAGKKTKAHYGDVCAIDPSGDPLMNLFTIDLKRGYPRTDIQGLLEGHKGERSWHQWILDAQNDARNAGTPYWMVVQKRDRRDTIVVTPGNSVNLIYTEQLKNIGHLIADVSGGKTGLFVTSLDIFFAAYSIPRITSVSRAS